MLNGETRSSARRGTGTVELSAEGRLARRLLEARRKREEMLGADLFRDPAWDILLDLFLAHE